MPLFLLLSEDSSLETEIPHLLGSSLKAVSIVRVESAREISDCLNSLEGVSLVLHDTRTETLDPDFSTPVLRLIPEGEPPPDSALCLTLPLRAAETRSLIRLILSPSVTGSAALLRRDRKFEAIALFQANLAHDVNNCLTTLLGNLGFLPTLLPSEPQMIEDMQVAADNAATLIRQVQAFTRRQPLAPHPLDLCTLLRHMHEPARRLCGPDSPLEMLVYASEAWVSADEGALEQALFNLLACASVERTALLLSLDCEDSRARISLRLSDSTHFSVDEATLPGLACTLELLRLSGVESRFHEAGVELWINRIPPPIPLQPLPVVPPLRVLIAERHPEVRRCLRRFLEERGHQVLTAGDGLEARESLQKSPSVDMAVMDITLLRSGADRLPLDATTLCVWTLPAAGYRHSLPEEALTLAKPYSPEDLLRIWASSSGDILPLSPDLQKRPTSQKESDQLLPK